MLIQAIQLRRFLLPSTVIRFVPTFLFIIIEAMALGCFLFCFFFFQFLVVMIAEPDTAAHLTVEVPLMHEADAP